MSTARLPRFFIVGAPKCGTTSLERWLSSNPSVYMPPVKEPMFFATDLAFRRVREESEYAALYRRAKPGQVAGDASPEYLLSRAAVPAIEAVVPDARYVVMTRDPVEMVVSFHSQLLRWMLEDEPDLAAAWRLQEARSRGERLPPRCPDPLILQYREWGALGSQLERLMATVPADRLLHIPLDALRADPRRTYLSVLEFIGATDDGRTAFPAFNQAAQVRSQRLQGLLYGAIRLRKRLGFARGWGLAHRLNIVNRPHAPAPDALAMIAAELEGERRLLARLTERTAAESSLAAQSSSAA